MAKTKEIKYIPQRSAIKHSVGDRVFNVCNIVFFALIGLIIIFPFFNIVAISLTSNVDYMREPFIL